MYFLVNKHLFPRGKNESNEVNKKKLYLFLQCYLNSPITELRSFMQP